MGELIAKAEEERAIALDAEADKIISTERPEILITDGNAGVSWLKFRVSQMRESASRNRKDDYPTNVGGGAVSVVQNNITIEQLENLTLEELQKL